MHHELPERLDVEWYRTRARELLRSFNRSEPEALSRVREVVGDRAPIKLADAQRVIAAEHGFRTWAEFKRWVESRAPEPRVGRIGRAPIASYEARAAELVAHAAEEDSIRRVRRHVARLASFDGGALTLGEARLVV